MPYGLPLHASWPHTEASLDACQAPSWPESASALPLRHPHRFAATAFTSEKTPPGPGPGGGDEEGGPAKSGNMDIMNEAIHSADSALHKAMRSMSDSRMLHTRLGDLKAERVTTSLRLALENLVHDSSSLNDTMQKIAQENVALEKAHSQHVDTYGPVKTLADDVEKATATMDDMEKYMHRFYRRAWALTDIYHAASSRPSLEDTLEPPKGPDEDATEVQDQGIKTSAGCECMESSTCSEHGRDFKWCVVKEPNKALGIKCPLYWDPTEQDAAGNDHRVAGAGVPSPMWDYCRMPAPEDPTDVHQPQQDPTVPAFAHRGCKCGFRGDLLGKYANNPSYKDKAGKFDWSRVPWSDRLGLEAMVVHYFRNTLAHDSAGGVGAPENNEENICVRTSTSGSLHVCPAINANEDQQNPRHLGDPGWCGTHSWDFCVPPEADDKGGDEEAAFTASADPTLGIIAPLMRQTWSTDVQTSRRSSRQRVGRAFL